MNDNSKHPESNKMRIQRKQIIFCKLRLRHSPKEKVGEMSSSSIGLTPRQLKGPFQINNKSEFVNNLFIIYAGNCYKCMKHVAKIN